MLYIHVTLVPFIPNAGELKTKPTQHSVNELRRIGIHPDVLVCRSIEPLTKEIRDKIALFADVDLEAVISAIDVPDVYLVPKALQEQGLDRLVCERLGIETPVADLGEWDELIERLDARRETVEIALVWQVRQAARCLPVGARGASGTPESRRAARCACAGSTPRTMKPLDEASRRAREGRRRARAGRLPGSRGSRGRFSPVASRARMRSRTSASASGSTLRSPSSRAMSAGSRARISTEMDPETPYAVIDLLPEQKDVEDLGGSMRLGAQCCRALPRIADAREVYGGKPVVSERHRHRYEVNNAYRQQLEDAGARDQRHLRGGPAGRGDRARLLIIPWVVDSQFHPEFKWRPTRPAPLFREFVAAALERARLREREAGRGADAVVVRLSDAV